MAVLVLGRLLEWLRGLWRSRQPRGPCPSSNSGWHLPGYGTWRGYCLCAACGQEYECGVGGGYWRPEMRDPSQQGKHPTKPDPMPSTD